MSELIPNNSDFFLYTSQDGEVRVDVFVHNESVWLTQKQCKIYLTDQNQL